MRRIASVFFAVVAMAWADEKPVAQEAATAAAKEDAITAAARDFQNLKVTRSGLPVEKSGLNLSGLTTPDFQNGGVSAVVMPSGKKLLDPKKKTANWLVDGVLKKPEQASRDKTSRGSTHLADEEKSDDDPTSDPRREGLTERSSRGEESKPSEAELNPLMRYMSGWMTSQDYALLRPGLAANVSADALSRGDPSLSGMKVDGTVNSFGADGVSYGLASAAAARSASSTARENPFLQSFETQSSPPPMAATPVVASEPVNTPSGRTLAPVESSPARAKVPEIAKPSDDAKYFKQLKRF